LVLVNEPRRAKQLNPIFQGTDKPLSWLTCVNLTVSVVNFMVKGAALEGAALAHPGPLVLIELRNGTNAPSYVAGTENFYTITRYKWNSY
jgi:hypothetical protein